MIKKIIEEVPFDKKNWHYTWAKLIDMNNGY